MNGLEDFLPWLGQAPAVGLLLVLWHRISDVGKKVDGFKERIGERMGEVEKAVAALQATVSLRQGGE